ncbi:MAG: helix-turn-helix domain-containing protein [Lentisphaeria bacterium]|nr:helix-turn-helix domain-containing protein [Lentisphaeria bacterium]
MIELLYWGHGQNDKIGKYVHKHKHDFCQLEIILCGSRKCQSDSKLFKLHQGEAVFIPMNVWHKFVDTSPDLEYFSFKFRVDDVDKMPRQIFKLPHDFLIDWILDDFRRLANNDMYNRSPLHLRLITHLLDTLYRHLLLEKYILQEPPLLTAMRQQIYRCGVMANVSYIAEEMHISTTRLRREFKRVMKNLPPRTVYWENPSDFLKHELTRIIAAHLRESQMSIGELAEMFHFSNVYTFSRYFKVNTGYSPSVYRKKFGCAAISDAESFPEQLQ